MTPDGYMDDHDWAKCPYFKEAEFICPCCGRSHIKFQLVQSLLVLRANVGKPIHVNSGFRCPKHNAEVGGEPDSQHIIGAAADIRVDGMKPQDLAYQAERVKAFNAGGIGTYPASKARRGWVHVDVRNGRARWTR